MVQSTLKYLYLGPSLGRGQYRLSSLQVQTLVPFHRLEVIDVEAFDTWILPEPFNELDIEASVAAMAHILPPCVRQLTLRRGSTGTILHALEILKVKHQETAKLEILRIILDELNVIEYFAVEGKALVEAGVKCGVEVSVEGLESDPYAIAVSHLR
jgi:hypothetical protein